jgi:hypothetical protein
VLLVTIVQFPLYMLDSTRMQLHQTFRLKSSSASISLPCYRVPLR